MEGVSSLQEIIRPDDFFTKIDLKDAYLTVPLHREDRKFIQIRWGGQLFQFKTLAFGLTSAPFLFTKILKPIVTFLRFQGFRLVIYLDDILLLNSCKREAEREFLAATELLEKCGFVINIEKSIGTPHQVIEFLGLIVDSRNLSLSLRAEKVDEIIRLCRNLFSKGSAPLREIAKVLGLFAWAIKAVPFAQSHYRDLQRLYIEGCVRFENNLNSLVLLDSGSKINLSWWVANLTKCNGKPMLAVDPELTIYSDASNSGWGGVLNGVSTRGPWTEADRLRHINELELLAALYSLKAFTSQLEGISIRLMMDNSTAVCYVNKAGGTRSKSLNNIAADIMCWCESRKISVHAVHLPGILNSLADLQSRWKRESSDWKLKTSIFSQLSELWAPEVDLFASHWNRQVARFMSWKPQPESVALDAFTQNWKNLKGYAFPPFNLIHRCLIKIRRDRADVLMVTPVWPSQQWWPTILELSYRPARILKPSEDLLLDATGISHPLLVRGSLLLAAWTLSGDDMKTEAFRREWCNYSWPAIAKPHQLLTKVPGTFGSIGALRGVKIPCLLL
jgi:hypothetical protein